MCSISAIAFDTAGWDKASCTAAFPMLPACATVVKMRNSRSLTKTVLGSGLSGSSGKASRSLAMTVGLCKRKKVLISFSSASVVTSAFVGS